MQGGYHFISIVIVIDTLVTVFLIVKVRKPVSLVKVPDQQETNGTPYKVFRYVLSL